MKPSELRIGNYIKEPIEIGGNITTVQHITTDGDGYNHFIDHASPIPLTEKWLLKFGLKKYDNEYHFDNGTGLHFVFKSQWYLYRNELNGNKSTIAYGFEYVHTAQNLIHSITGEELTISE